MFKNEHKTLISEWMNGWMNADFLHGNTYSGKLRVTVIIIGEYVQI